MSLFRNSSVLNKHEPLPQLDVPMPVPAASPSHEPRWSRALTITIDGPAGSGKSTVARLVAETLGFTYIDTGATYRALAWLAIERGIPLDDGDRLRGLAIAQPVDLPYSDDQWQVRIGGRFVTGLIRTAEIDQAASLVARHPEVRDVLVGRQRQLSMQRDCVLDGRDCGTRVRGDADLKLYVTAELNERVRRRTLQMSGSQRRRVERDMRERDARDAPQSAAAGDAIVIDSTNVSVDDVVADIVDRWLVRRAEILDGEITAGRTAREWIDGLDMVRFQRTMRTVAPALRRMFRVQAHGVERVPDRNCLFIANHVSMWDPSFVIIPLGRPVRYMSKVENTRTPLIRKLGDSIGIFPVRRGGGDRVAMHMAESVLRRGDSLGIFPEGTRVYENRLSRPRSGAARLALVTGVPIVPVAIYGNRYTESAFRVSVAYGKPHTFDGVRATPANVAAATRAVWADVEELWNAMREGRWAW